MERNKTFFGGTNIFFESCEEELQNLVIGDFRSFIAGSVGKESAALEIGPSYSPILPKSAGFNTRIVDHADQATLRAKYGAFSEDIKNGIETVDFVWAAGSLKSVIKNETFQFVVASHAIEHFVDFLGFLRDCTLLLNENGELLLIVPDKRFCFDYFQPASDVAKIIGDHLRSSLQHSFEAHYRQSMHAVAELGTRKIHFWGQEHVRSLSFLNGDPEAAYKAALQNMQSGEYHDAHNNFFTPASFLVLIEELRYLGLVDFHVETITRPRGCEFLTIMRRDDRPKVSLDEFLVRKSALLMQTLVEEHERLSFSPLSTAAD